MEKFRHDKIIRANERFNYDIRIVRFPFLLGNQAKYDSCKEMSQKVTDVIFIGSSFCLLKNQKILTQFSTHLIY
jgi:hypothetical protein